MSNHKSKYFLSLMSFFLLLSIYSLFVDRVKIRIAKNIAKNFVCSSETLESLLSAHKWEELHQTHPEAKRKIQPAWKALTTDKAHVLRAQLKLLRKFYPKIQIPDLGDKDKMETYMKKILKLEIEKVAQITPHC